MNVITLLHHTTLHEFSDKRRLAFKKNTSQQFQNWIEEMKRQKTSKLTEQTVDGLQFRKTHNFT